MYKNTNQDDAQHMARGMTNVASSTTSKEVCRGARSSTVNTIEKETTQTRAMHQNGDGTFSLQVKLDSKLHQVHPRCVTYALQKLFKEELERI